jgi:hypothetical protein
MLEKSKMNEKMLKHRNITIERFDKFISDIYFVNANLRGLIYPKNKQKKVDLKVYSVKNIEPTEERIPYSEAIKGDFIKTEVGKSFGPTWFLFFINSRSTHWFFFLFILGLRLILIFQKSLKVKKFI